MSPSVRRVFAYGSNLHLPALRAWAKEEGHPHRYLRSPMTVHLLGGGTEKSCEAWVYVVTEGWVQDHPQWPRLDYLVTVLGGALALGLPREHLRALFLTPHQDPEAGLTVTPRALDPRREDLELFEGASLIARWRADATEPELLPGHERIGEALCRETLAARRTLLPTP